jgi:Ca2+-binding RTX toxin-like protein
VSALLLALLGVEVVNVVDGGDNTSGTKALAGSDAVITLGAYATAVKVDASGLDAGTGAAAETLTLTANGATKAITAIGGAAADTINMTGATGNNVIDGGAGNDAITAGSGIDNINGGSGDDSITFAAGLLTGDDTVAGGDGVNTLNVSTVEGDVAFLNVSGIQTLNAAASATIVIGTKAQASGINKVTATAATDNTIDASSFTSGLTFDTNDGTDSLLGGTGSDTFVFAGTTNLTAADVIKASTGTDSIRLDNGSATTGIGAAVTVGLGVITGVESITVNDLGALDTNGDVSVTFGAAYAQTSVTVDGSQLDLGETLTVDANANASTEVVSLIGGAGADTLTGGAANDNIQGGSGSDNLVGNGGNDTIDTGSGNNVVDGGAGNDTITGGSGNDSLTGGADSDVINGGAAADTLVGGAGADNLTGGDGVDVFKFTAASESTNLSTDTVADFTRGTDLLDLQIAGQTVRFVGSASTGFDAQTLLASGVAGGQVVFDKSTSSVWMDTNGDGTLDSNDLKITLTNVTDFAASDLLGNAPALALASDTGSSNTDGITSTAAGLVFTGINTASSTVEVFDDLNNDGLMNTGEKLGNATVTTTTWTFTNAGALAAGSHNIRSLETTKAGTVLTSSSAKTVVVDATAPVAAAATTFSGDNNATITTAEGAAGFVITGTREAGATVTIAGQVVTTPTDTTWSTTISPASVVGFGQGAENLTVVSTDTAGNATNATVALTVAVTGAAAATDLNTLMRQQQQLLMQLTLHQLVVQQQLLKQLRLLLALLVQLITQ